MILSPLIQNRIVFRTLCPLIIAFFFQMRCSYTVPFLSWCNLISATLFTGLCEEELSQKTLLLGFTCVEWVFWITNTIPRETLIQDITHYNLVSTHLSSGLCAITFRNACQRIILGTCICRGSWTGCQKELWINRNITNEMIMRRMSCTSLPPQWNRVYATLTLFFLFGGILGSGSRAEFPVSPSNHVGFKPRLLYSSTRHSSESFIHLGTGWSQDAWLQWSHGNLVFPSWHQPLTLLL